MDIEQLLREEIVRQEIGPALPPAYMALEYVTKEENWEGFLEFMKTRAAEMFAAIGQTPTREETQLILPAMRDAYPDLDYIS